MVSRAPPCEMPPIGFVPSDGVGRAGGPDVGLGLFDEGTSLDSESLVDRQGMAGGLSGGGRVLNWI